MHDAPSTDPSGVDWLAHFPPPRSLPLDREAQRIYEHAYAIGLRVEKATDPPITFSTVIAALLVGADDTSRWFRQLATTYGPLPEAVFREKKDITEKRDMTETLVHALRPPRPGRPEDLRLSRDKHLLTSSARSVLVGAEGWAQRVGRSDIGVRHVVASYVLNPPVYHREQMQRWQFQESLWREKFFEWVAPRYTAEQWAEASERPAPASAIPEIEQQEVKGGSLAYPADAHVRGVLERAARLHARRSDTWLRLQTLWHALVEATDDEAIRSAIPIVAAVKKVPGYLGVFEKYFPASANRTVVEFDALDISPRVLNALESARELAVATRTDRASEARVSVLHLAGALASRRVDCDDELVSLGFKPPRELRLALIQHAESKGQSSIAWREALGEDDAAQAGRPLELNSDEPEAVVRLDEDWTSDPLRIRRDVETFAALLASKSLEPPLSIGLFGPWGSGKTTFMRRLQRAIKRRAQESRTHRDTPYVSNVVHVDFNAWHFAEGALTSSLVDTILRRIQEYIEDKHPKIGEAWRQQTLDKLETARRNVAAAEAVEQAARAAVATAQDTVAQKERVAADAAVNMRAAMTEVWSQTVKAFQSSPEVKNSGVLEALGSTVASAEDLRARIEALHARPARLLTELGWRRALFFAGLILIVPLGVGWFVAEVVGTNAVAQVLSFVTAAVPIVGAWTRSAAQAVAKVDAAAIKVADEYARRIATDENVVAARAAVAAAQANATTAAAGLQAAHAELARAQTAAANATLPAQMLQLVSSRVDAQAYAKELTTLSMARADLEKLSILLHDQLGDAAAQPATGDPPATPLRAVERVILYVDDLDRCKPTDVVRVLQMVHMLLAFELFAVVVAVDARWVRESLRQGYKWLASDDIAGAKPAMDGDGALRHESITSGVSPQDYLEKIFQIAYWLEPMTVQRAAEYLRSLVRTQARESGPVLGMTPPTDLTAAGSSRFRSVPIFPIERDYMSYLAAYVGSSPRRVKRLVNAYRLIKASLPDSQLETFLTKTDKDESGRFLSGPYQIVIGLLAVGTGAPASCARILRDIVDSDPADTGEALLQRFRGRQHPDWSLAARILEVVMRTQKAKDVSDLRSWASSVGRFLLNSPHDVRLDRQPPA